MSAPDRRPDRRPDRQLRAEAVLDATPAEVWALLSDLRRMGEWSPELVCMVPLPSWSARSRDGRGAGGLRVGRSYLGLNRRKAVVWPTRSVLAVLEPGRVLAWDTVTSGARWIWELAPEGEGTRVVHRRPVPAAITRGSRLFAPVFLGGSAAHADELEDGMRRTVARLQRAVEAAGARRTP